MVVVSVEMRNQREGQRPEGIPAWGSAPGMGNTAGSGLKARRMDGIIFITMRRAFSPCLFFVWSPGAAPQAGMLPRRWRFGLAAFQNTIAFLRVLSALRGEILISGKRYK